MHVSYSSILVHVGAVGLSQYNVRDFVNLGGGGSSGNFLNFKGVEEFSGSRGMRIYGRLTNFQYPREGWPMSDNNIFQGGFRPPKTLWSNFEKVISNYCERLVMARRCLTFKKIKNIVCLVW